MFSIRSRRAKLLLLSSSFGLIVYLIRRYRRYVILKKRQALGTHREEILPNANGISPTVKKTINRQFFHQIRVLLRIIIPNVRSDSFLLLVTHLTTLITRTFLSIYLAHIDGAVVKSLVQRNPRDFIRAISIFLAVAVPSSFVNSFIRFAESKLALALRSRLTRHAYEAYFRVRCLPDDFRWVSFSSLESDVLSSNQFG